MYASITMIGKANEKYKSYLMVTLSSLYKSKSRWIWTVFSISKKTFDHIINQDSAFTILLGDFSANSKSCWVYKITNNEVNKLNLSVLSNIRINSHPPKFIILHCPNFYRSMCIWDYKNTNASSIHKALNMINWNKLFSNANVEE